MTGLLVGFNFVVRWMGLVRSATITDLMFEVGKAYTMRPGVERIIPASRRTSGKACFEIALFIQKDRSFYEGWEIGENRRAMIDGHPSEGERPRTSRRTGVPKALSIFAALALVLLWGFVIYTGLRGVNFGYHPDEGWAQLVPLQKSLETWTFLPGLYVYPSLNYWLNLSGLLPYLIRFLVAGERGAQLANHLFAMVFTDQFQLSLRAIRVVISSLALVWMYIFVLVWRKSRVEAWLAAAILGLSWEIAYHARWIAPDDVVVQFATMTIMFVGLSVLRPKRVLWSRLGAVSAALATGTKYTAGLLILPVLLVVGWSWVVDNPRAQVWKPLFATIVLFGLTYLITTPGSVLQPWHFLRDIRLEQEIYGEAGHVGHTVLAGIGHLELMGEYLGLVLFSHYPTAAVLLAAFTLPGVVFVSRESRLLAIALLLFPVTFIAFLATQRVMFPRTLLMVAPFLVLFATRGISGLFHVFRSLPLRIGLAVPVAGILIFNAWWLAHAADTIANQGSNRFLAEAAQFAESHPQQRYLASPGVIAALASARIGLPPNLIDTARPDAGYVLVYASEAAARIDWTANIFDLTVRTFGPQAANFNYYPAEIGQDQIVLMTFSRACQSGVLFLRAVCPEALWNSLLKSRPPTHPVDYPTVR
jgi:Dolichyl-phosphate-mannose-protein mannosyltransferase